MSKHCNIDRTHACQDVKKAGQKTCVDHPGDVQPLLELGDHGSPANNCKLLIYSFSNVYANILANIWILHDSLCVLCSSRSPTVRATRTQLSAKFSTLKYAICLVSWQISMKAFKTTVIFSPLSLMRLVVGAWLLAVLIGLSAGTLLRRLGPFVTGSLSYSITFFTYAAMITSGVIVHSFFLVECGQEQPNNFFRLIGIVDESLTSCIALSFFFNGLIDLNIMTEREFSSLWVRMH